VILRALTMAVGDAARTPRSLTVHYLAPPAEGEVDVEVRVERSGRSLTSLSARLVQGDRLLALALAAFATPRTGVEFAELRPPSVPPAGEVAVRGGPAMIPMQERFEARPALGPEPFSGTATAEVGGWLRLTEPRPYDHLLVAMLADAWVPAVFSRMTPDDRVGVPTVDLTVHFRSAIPPSLRPEDHALVVFRTQVAQDGFIEEDGEIWTADGVLLAQSRQLAVLLG
jgi:acyl-CoA thioesterase